MSKEDKVNNSNNNKDLFDFFYGSWDMENSMPINPDKTSPAEYCAVKECEMGLTALENDIEGAMEFWVNETKYWAEDAAENILYVFDDEITMAVNCLIEDMRNSGELVEAEIADPNQHPIVLGMLRGEAYGELMDWMIENIEWMEKNINEEF